MLTPKNVFLLLVATLSWSLVALFVKAIPLPADMICFGRALFGGAAMAVVLMVSRQPLFRFHERADILKLLVPGLLLCGNWFFYVLSIKVSSIAIAIISLFTYPLLISIIEPFVFRVRHRPIDLVGGCAIVAGVALIAPRFTLADTAVQGICLGVLSGLCFALSSLASRKLVSRYSSTNLMWFQFLTIAVVFSPSPIVHARPVSMQTIVFLFILGSVLTTLASVSFVASLKTITTSVAGMFTATQPFLAVVLAAIFLHEVPTRRTIIGGLVVCGAVAGVSLWHMLEQRRRTAPPLTAKM